MNSRCLIWGTGTVFCQNIKLVQGYEKEGEVSVIAVTGNTTVFSSMLGYRYVQKERLVVTDYDLVIVMSERYFCDIEKEAIEIGFRKDQVIKFIALTDPSFNFERFIQLKQNVPTIFANNCWGGITYNRLGLKFQSPFINMFVQEKDYLKFLDNPQWYMEQPLLLKKTAYNEELQIEYPVCMCGDIELYFNHYPDYSQAEACWQRRKKRINWENLFVAFYTENPESARQFNDLPFEKKICFVPFESDLKSVHTLKFCNEREMKKVPFYKIVSGIAKGVYPYYDSMELLMTGRIRQISE